MSRTQKDWPAPHPLLTGLALAALGALCAAPLLLESTSFVDLVPYAESWQTGLACGVVLLAMLLVVGVRTWLDREAEPHAPALNVLFVALAIDLTWMHWRLVDSVPLAADWQDDLYRRLFQHAYDAPHQYRPLPYGFVRSLERLTHQYFFSCLAYRAFFTYWFVWAWYRLARTVHEPGRAVLTLSPLIILYPISIFYYLGQLTDPVSHALMIFGLVCVLEDRPFALAGALALGVVAKETAVLLVPVYLACHCRQGRKALFTTAALGLVAVAAFLAARLPLGWRLGERTVNGAGLMLGTNLGIGQPIAGTAVPLWMNYLHPVLFVGLFLPFIAWNWRRSDGRLRVLFATLTPLLLLSNLCFGWLYESRNYVPLLPVLTTLALPSRRADRRADPPFPPFARGG